MYKKILIPTDGSPIATAAAHDGIAFAKHIGAEVVGIFVAQQYDYPTYTDGLSVNNWPTEEHDVAMRKAGEQYLGEIAAESLNAGVKYSEILVFSHRPAEQIVETAQQNGCDLIFMGSHGRSGWGQLLLGSVTAKVLAGCDIPVLVTRSSKRE
jgi:nucleotide-binding universal stress UspA family protein